MTPSTPSASEGQGANWVGDRFMDLKRKWSTKRLKQFAQGVYEDPDFFEEKHGAPTHSMSGLDMEYMIEGNDRSGYPIAFDEEGGNLYDRLHDLGEAWNWQRWSEVENYYHKMKPFGIDIAGEFPGYAGMEWDSVSESLAVDWRSSTIIHGYDHPDWLNRMRYTPYNGQDLLPMWYVLRRNLDLERQTVMLEVEQLRRFQY